MKRTFQIVKANLELVETPGQFDVHTEGSVKNLKLETQRELHDTRVRR
jgi:hypothetical protein